MKTKLISLEVDKINHRFTVEVLIGDKKETFTGSIETARIADRAIEGVKGDREFLEFFRWNQNLAVAIYQTILQAYRGENLELPREIGNFIPREESLLSST